jgi:L-lactate dehydrogenase complex protein LldG
MDDRERILNTLRRRPPAGGPLPPHDGPWQRFADPAAQFARVLESVGGVCRRLPARTALAGALEALPVWRQAARRLSLLPEVTGRGVGAMLAGRDAAAIDVALLAGRFAVAENAAVWVDAADVPHRALFHLPQHVALAVPASELVHNMHEAYARLDLIRRGFGCFVSGPSKTADIEQALVIGAHGPRSLTVFLVDDH